MKSLIVNIGLVVLIFSCTTKPQSTEIEISRIGALRQIMHAGKIGSRVNLDTMDLTNAWGLGASDSLQGELLVLNGNVFESKVTDRATAISNNRKAEATLLVLSKVQAWDTVQVSSFDQVETLLVENGYNSPAPFVLLGSPELLEYHIINFNPKVSDISNHKEGAYLDVISNSPVTILGFYSKTDQGVFTHHDSNVHMHFIDDTKQQAGHIEKLVPGSNSFQLLIPKK